MSSASNRDTLIGYNLKKVQHGFRRQLDDALRSVGLTTAQYAVLNALNETPDQTNADLARLAFITPQSMQTVLAGLEKTGDVVRKEDQDHGRRQLARLTEKGQARAEQGRATAISIEDKLIAAAAPFAKEDVLELLRRFQEALD